MSDKDAERARISAEVQSLQSAMGRTQRELIATGGLIEAKQKLSKKHEYTTRELNALPVDTKTYKAVGRMYDC
jgi:hypothetical protein